jgi:hypothetical protein
MAAIFRLEKPLTENKKGTMFSFHSSKERCR